jgi:ferrous iron transport protein B
MSDEAQACGLQIDTLTLSRWLDCPVIETTAVRGQGLSELRQALMAANTPRFELPISPAFQTSLAEIFPCLPESNLAPRALALLWLSGDPSCDRWLREHLTPEVYRTLLSLRSNLENELGCPVAEALQRSRFDYVNKLLPQVLIQAAQKQPGFASRLAALTIHPVWGLVILAIVLYGLYWFVGVFGAGWLVNLFEVRLFGEIINPFVTNLVLHVIPFPLLQQFLVGEFGLWTMGMTYALALILPIVTTFFLAFGVLEDSGYLPRLAVLSNRLFQRLGLNGKAVLPMVLGLGCVTMATLTTRVLETRRERLLAILLLALAVPCSAQLGVVMGMLASISIGATLIWSAVVLGVFLVVGWLAARLVPGERSSLLVELPPLRVPVFSNVWLKTVARLEWYIKEVIPLFLLGTAVLFALAQTGLLAWLTAAASPLVTGWLELPAEASAAFLMGFMRRDFGATGLFVLQSQGSLSPAQVVTAMVTITLFVPCIASVMMIAKERSWRAAVGMLVLIFPLAVLVGGLLARALAWVGWGA